jgi:N-glycosylase/DNA lyase
MNRTLLFHNTHPPFIWLRGCLSNGQVFTWKSFTKKILTAEEEYWRGVILCEPNKFPVAVELIQQSRKPGDLNLHPVYFRPLSQLVVSKSSPSNQLHDDDILTVSLQSFFRANKNDIEPPFQEWCNVMPRMKLIEPLLRGVRLIRQDPVECLFAFICSSNNNILRIQKMVSHLKQKYGTPLVPISTTTTNNDNDDMTNDILLYSFPSITNLATKATEQELRDMGFGYRAKYIVQTAQALLEKDANYLQQLLSTPNSTNNNNNVIQELLQFQGIGPKVAGCIALCGLEQLNVVPIDVHVLRLTQREFGKEYPDLQQDTLTKTCIHTIQNIYQTRFGNLAGYAQLLLFTAELVQFRDFLPVQVLQTMNEFKLVSASSRKSTLPPKNNNNTSEKKITSSKNKKLRLIQEE